MHSVSHSDQVMRLARSVGCEKRNNVGCRRASTTYTAVVDACATWFDGLIPRNHLRCSNRNVLISFFFRVVFVGIWQQLFDSSILKYSDNHMLSYAVVLKHLLSIEVVLP